MVATTTSIGVSAFDNDRTLALFSGPICPKPTLSVADARALVADDEPLLLCDVTDLTPEVAAVLATHHGLMFLDGLTSLGPEVAAALEPHGGVLFLDGLTDLAPQSAESLARHHGVLVVFSLRDFPAPVAATLARHPFLVEVDVYLPHADRAHLMHRVGKELHLRCRDRE